MCLREKRAQSRLTQTPFSWVADDVRTCLTPHAPYPAPQGLLTISVVNIEQYLAASTAKQPSPSNEVVHIIFRHRISNAYQAGSTFNNPFLFLCRWEAKKSNGWIRKGSKKPQNLLTWIVMETSCYLEVQVWTESRTQTPVWALPTKRET